MYTHVDIKWADNGESWENQIIKANDEFDPLDDEIFFYGLSREELLECCKNGELCEGEWRVVSVGRTSDCIGDLI